MRLRKFRMCIPDSRGILFQGTMRMRREFGLRSSVSCFIFGIDDTTGKIDSLPESVGLDNGPVFRVPIGIILIISLSRLIQSVNL